MPLAHSLLIGYGAIALATTLFFWIFTVMGFFNPELRADAESRGLSLPFALFMGVVMGVTWPKAMFRLFKFIHAKEQDNG